MSLSPGTRLGPYEIAAPIDAGGMGEVYKATDTKLSRDVALKVLPDAFATAAGAMRAVAFDLATLETHGTPVPVVPDVVTSTYGALDAVVAGDGTLAYVSGAPQAAARTLVWVDRRGREEPITAPVRAYVYPRLSPDGTRVAVEVRDQEWDIWIASLASTTFTRFSFGPNPDRVPTWTPDGRRIIWGSEREGVSNIYWQAADGSGSVEQLTQSPIAL